MIGCRYVAQMETQKGIVGRAPGRGSLPCRERMAAKKVFGFQPSKVLKSQVMLVTQIPGRNGRQSKHLL